VNKIKTWSLFCEDVRIEHDYRCTLVGVSPSVAIIAEPLKMRQMCLVFSCEFPIDLDVVELQHEIEVTGSVSEISEKFKSGRHRFERPTAVASEKTWQVITYLVQDKVEFDGSASMRARIWGDDFSDETSLTVIESFEANSDLDISPEFLN
jgi:hypothetical protein